MKTPDFIHGCGSIGCATIILAIIVAIIIHACGCATEPKHLDIGLEKNAIITPQERMLLACENRKAWEEIDTTPIGVEITNRLGHVLINNPDGSQSFVQRGKNGQKIISTTRPAPVKRNKPTIK